MKIDVDKFVAELLKTTTAHTTLDRKDIIEALHKQDLEYYDGEIVKADPKEPEKPLWCDHVREVRHEALEKAKQGKLSESKFNKEKLMEVAKPETLEEKLEHYERMKKIVEDKIKEWALDDKIPTFSDSLMGKLKEDIQTVETKEQDPVLQKLNKIIELLNRKIVIENIFSPRLTDFNESYDPNRYKVYCDSASASTEKGEDKDG